MSSLATAWVAIRPDLSGFGTALNRGVQQSANPRTMGRGLRGRMGSVGRMAGGALGLSIGAAAAGAFVKSSVSIEAEFSKTMSMVGANLRLPQKDIQKMSDLAMKMGRDTVFSANDAATAMLELAKNGIKPATIQAGALKSALTLAAAGGVGMEEAATVMGNALNTFNLKGKDSAKVAAALAGAANSSSASISSIAQGLAQAGTGAAQAGLSIEETTAALAAFANKGIQGSDAGTSLKTMLQRLIPQTTKAADAMEQYGLVSYDAKVALKELGKDNRIDMSGVTGDIESVRKAIGEMFTETEGDMSAAKLDSMVTKYMQATGIMNSELVDSKGNFEDLSTIAGSLHDHLAKLNDQERTNALTTIFGSDASRAAAIMMNTGRKGVEKYTKATKDRNAADRMAKASMSGTSGALERLSGSFETLQLAVGQALAPLVQLGAKWLGKIINKVSEFISSLTSGKGEVQGFSDKLKPLIEFGKALVPTIKDLAQQAKDVLLPGFRDISALIQEKLIPAFNEMLPTILPIAKFILKMFGSAIIGVFKGAIRFIKGFIETLTGIFHLVKAVLTGDWSAMWDAVKEILGGAFDAIIGAFEVWFNAGILSMFKNGIKTLLMSWKGLWKGAQKVTSAATKVLGDILRALWKKVIGPVFKSVGKVITFTVKKVVWPVLKFLWTFISKVLIPIFKFLWTNVIKVYFKLIGLYIKTAWNFIIKPIFKALWTFISKVLVPLFRFLWSKVVKPIFGYIGGLIKDTWTKAIKPIFEKIAAFIGERLVPAFRNGIARIGDIWGKLKKAAAVPVNFVIETVYNNGIRKLINALPGVKDLPKIAKVSWGATKDAGPIPTGVGIGGFEPTVGGFRPWTGGWTGPGSKMTPAGIVHADEFVIKKESRRKVERDFPGLLDTLNGYASGGRVWPVPGHTIAPNYDNHDGIDINRGSGWDDFGDPIRAAVAGIISYVGSGRGYGTAIFEKGSFGELVYGHTSQTHVRTGQHVNAGDLIGNVGNTGNSSAPHLHFGFPGGTYAQALAFLNGADVSGGSSGGGGGGGFFSWLGDKFKSVKGAVGAFGDKITGWVDAVRDQPGWGGMLADMVGNVGGKVKDWIGDKIRGFFGGGGGTSGGTPGNVSSYTGTVQSVLRMLGQPLSLTDDVLRRMNQESGGNPNAVNNWDSNWQAGHPSVGLMQVIRGTFDAYAGPYRGTGPFSYGVSTNPLANIYAGLNYALHRYGNLAGPMNQPGGYDQGGIANGKGYMRKDTLRPERVLSPKQTESFDRLVSTLESLDGPGGSDRDRNLLAAAIYKAARDGIAERNSSAYARTRIGV